MTKIRSENLPNQKPPQQNLDSNGVITCTFQSNLENQGTSHELKIEDGKKYSFHLPLDLLPSPSSYFEILKPASIVLKANYKSVEYESKDDKFVFAGLEIISNSRNIESYELVSLENDHKNRDSPNKNFNYISTQKGTKCAVDPDGDKDDDEWYTTIITHPQGPTEVNGIMLKLLSLRPAKVETATIQKLVTKCRLLPNEHSTSVNLGSQDSSTSMSNVNLVSTSSPLTKANESKHSYRDGQYQAFDSTNLNQKQNSSNIDQQPSKSDVSDTLAVMSMIARSTEDRIVDKLGGRVKELEEQMIIMNEHMKKQSEVISELNKVLLQQHQDILERDESIKSLIQNQSKLLDEIHKKSLGSIHYEKEEALHICDKKQPSNHK